MPIQTYSMIPASNSVYWFMLPFAGIMLVAVGFVAWALYGSSHTRFTLNHGSLRISGDPYGREIPADHLRWSEAKTVDLRSEKMLQPAARVNGTGLPGYSAGWFRLSDSSKALVFLTDRTRVVYVPTTDGYSVMLSVNNPESFLQAARAVRN